MATKSVIATPQLALEDQFQGVGTWATPACMFSADIIALSLVYWIAVLSRFYMGMEYDLSFYLRLSVAITLFPIAFFIQGLYPGYLLHPAEELRRVFYSISVVFLLLALITFFWHSADAYSRAVILLTWMGATPTVLLSRYLLRHFLSQKTWWGVPAIVLGSGPSARRVIRTLKDKRFGTRVVGVMTDEQGALWPEGYPPILGPLNAAPEMACVNSIPYAIVAMPDKTSNELKHAIQDYCRGFRHVLWVPDLPGVCSMGITPREIGGEVGFEVPQRLFHTSNFVAKRVLDCVISMFAILILSPVFVAVAISVAITSPGGAFFGHGRLGRDGQKFKAYKFRTMVKNGEAVLSAYLKSNPEHQREWDRDQKLKKDPRVTPLGRFLRRSSLDELPQLFNVLIGNMSLVGPRPIYAAEEIAKFGRAYDLYKRVAPGITGLWQVSGRNNTTYDERVAFDEYYVHNWSVWLDAYILIRTVRVVLTGEGAY